MKKTGIFYGSSMGNTKTVAKQLAKALDADLYDVADNPSAALATHDNLIFGSSTWGIGDLQDDWEGFISTLGIADLNGRTVALFGLGDSSAYPDSFVDAMGTLYETIKNKGCKIIGATSTIGYDYDASTAEVNSGEFIGLALDDDNESELTDKRVNTWIELIKPQLQ